MRKTIIIAVLLCILLISGCELTGQVISERILESTVVIEVVDGDTLKTSDGETIRLLHVNTPEKGERCYSEAKTRLKELALNKQVWLERDMQPQDQYERSLKYIFLSENKNPNDYDGFVNLLLVREGYGTLLIVEPNMKYLQAFEQAAQEAEGCLWKASQYKGCFLVEEFHYNAEGKDCDNPNDEYIILKNNCDTLNLEGWSIKDEARHVYKFEDFIIKKGAQFTLYTGSGEDTEEELYWNRKGRCPAVWNNDHDSLFMKDSDENLVLYHTY